MRRAALLLVAVLASLTFDAAPATLARFSMSATSEATFGTATLAAPTSLAGSGGSSATLTWTPSTSAGAAGYHLLRSATPGSGYAQVKTVAPVSVATTTDSPASGTWYYVLQTYLGGWTSGMSNEASVAVGSSTSTGDTGCAASAPETSASGDNDGYEKNPGLACSQDGAVAMDQSSGTTSAPGCNGPGSDRHRFWGFAFGLPDPVTSIDGITVRLAAGVNSLAGSPQVCVELSWDAGASWTPARTVALAATGITSYTLGGPTDTWGHTPWTPAQMGVSTFRVRITDIAAGAKRDFSLDFVGVRVDYTP